MNENEVANVRRMLAEQEARILISQQPEFSNDDLLQQVAFNKLVDVARKSPDLSVKSGVEKACKTTLEWRRQKESELGTVRRPAEKTDAESVNTPRSNDLRRNRPAVTVEHNPDGSVSEEDEASTAAILRAMARARGQTNPIVHHARLPASEE
jgi:hypothetical protein